MKDLTLKKVLLIAVTLSLMAAFAVGCSENSTVTSVPDNQLDDKALSGGRGSPIGPVNPTDPIQTIPPQEMTCQEIADAVYVELMNLLSEWGEDQE